MEGGDDGNSSSTPTVAVLIDLQVILLLPSRTHGLEMCAKETFLTEEQRNVTGQSAAGKQDMKTQGALKTPGIMEST